MIKLTDCDYCSRRIGFEKGHILCEAFPDGVPYEHMDRDLQALKICNNGIGFEPINKDEKTAE